MTEKDPKKSAEEGAKDDAAAENAAAASAPAADIASALEGDDLFDEFGA